MQYVQNRWIKENTIEYREYQDKISEAASKQNTLVVLPTAMGKTIIALLIVTKVLDRDMNKKIMFLAPTRPLVEQHKKTFEKFLKLGLNLAVITGKIKPKDRGKLYQFTDIVFATPQTVKNDIKKHVFSFKDFSLLIIDEAQHCVGDYAYTYIARRFKQEAEGIIVGLTASPGRSEKIREIKRHLGIEHVEIRSEKDKDVKPYIQDVDFVWVGVRLPKEIEDVKDKLEKMRDERIEELNKWGMINKTKMTKSEIFRLQSDVSRKVHENGFYYSVLSKISEILKLEHALELLETQSFDALRDYLLEIKTKGKTKADKRLASDERIEEIIKTLENPIEHPKILALKKIVEKELKDPNRRIIIFAQYRSTVRKIKEELEKVSGCHPTILVGQAGRDGLKQKEQVEIIRRYEDGEFNTLITTSIGEEGIHLGSATTAIFYEAVPSEVRAIQRRGRVGREQPGKVYVLITRNTRDEAYYWAALNKEKKMKKILYRMKDQLDLEKFARNK